jgi:hypothetical protein
MAERQRSSCRGLRRASSRGFPLITPHNIYQRPQTPVDTNPHSWLYAVIETGDRQMTQLSPLASALHSKVWPLVGHRASEQCETIDDEYAFMNEAVERYAPHLLDTPVEILGVIWGVSVGEALIWREEIRAVLSMVVA